MTGIVLNTNVLSIGSVDDQSLTVANADLYDCNSDEDVMYSSSATTLAVQGCTNSYSDETIQIESGDTLVLDSDETLTSDNLTITGTLTQTTTGVITLSGNLASSGTFNGGSGAISAVNFTETAGTFTSTTGIFSVQTNWTHTAGGTFTANNGNVTRSTGTGTGTWDVATTETLYDFTVSSATGTLTISSGDTFVVTHTFTHNNSNINTGTVEVQGSMTVGASAGGGSATISFLVTGDQVITTSGGSTGGLNINKSSGTVSVSGTNLGINSFTLASSGTGAFTAPSGTLSVINAWTHTGGGTFNHNNGNVTRATGGATAIWDVATSETFYDLTQNSSTGNMTIASGDTLVVVHTFTIAVPPL